MQGMKHLPTHTHRSYLTGFALALILTAIPFGVVWTGMLPAGGAISVIVVMAVIQVLVHLRYFLHLNMRTTPRENLLALAFAVVLIFIMVGGSLFIMFDLHFRMMR